MNSYFNPTCAILIVGLKGVEKMKNITYVFIVP